MVAVASAFAETASINWKTTNSRQARMTSLVSETRNERLLAWIEPIANGRFKAVIVPIQSDPGTSPSIPTAEEFPTFADARDWVEGKSIALGWEIRWMSSP